MGKPSIGDNYYVSYGLEKDPFPETGLDQNIYLTPEINRRLKQAKQHIVAEENSLLLSSPPGSGKSLIARKLLVLKNDDWKTSLVLANAEMSTEEFAFQALKQLAPELCESKELAVNMLHKFLEQCFKEQMIPVIVVDDGHQLPFDTLQFILQIADLRYQECFYHFVIFADETICEMLEKPGLRELKDGAIEYLPMPFFSREQLEAYINYRFSHAGDISEPVFSDKELDYIFKVSGGLPAGINTVARNLMLQGLSSDASRSGVKTFFLIVLTIVISIGAYYYYGNHFAPQTAGRPDTPAPPVPEQNEIMSAETVPASKQPVFEYQFSIEDALSLKLSASLTDGGD